MVSLLSVAQSQRTVARRLGFTLVELLVVIAIIGVMVGLLLPAVQAAREAARRMQCSNSQKQIALAMHNYHDTFGVFPYGYKNEVAGQTKRRDCWFQQLLPFVEQTAFYDAYMNVEATYGATAEYIHNLPVEFAGRPVATFMCASDPAGPARGGGGSDRGFQGNYAVCSGGGTPTTAVQVTASTVIDLNMIRDDAGGMFARQSRRGFRDCVDGSSNTVLLSEGIIRGASGGAWGELGGYWGGAPHGSFAFSTGEAPNTTVPDRAYSCKSTTFLKAPCENGNAGGLIGRWNFARSYHPGGVMTAMCDGSVSFISESLDRQTWRNLGNRADGGVLTNWN